MEYTALHAHLCPQHSEGMGLLLFFSLLQFCLCSQLLKLPLSFTLPHHYLQQDLSVFSTLCPFVLRQSSPLPSVCELMWGHSW